MYPGGVPLTRSGARYGGDRELPRRKPTATLIVSSSILNPREVIGKAFNQAPNSLVEAAKRRALDRAWSNRKICSGHHSIYMSPKPSDDAKLVLGVVDSHSLGTRV